MRNDANITVVLLGKMTALKISYKKIGKPLDGKEKNKKHVLRGCPNHNLGPVGRGLRLGEPRFGLGYP